MPETVAAVPSLRPGRRRRVRDVGIVLALAVVALLTVAIASASAAEIGEVNLAKYERVGRYNLPAPPGTTPPNGWSKLAQEASGVTYDWENGTLFVVGDGGSSVVQVDKEGHLISSMTLAEDPSGPQNTTFYDTEGIAFVGNEELVITEERRRWIDRFKYEAEGELTRANAQKIELGTGNIGLEGVTNDPVSGGLVLVKEMDPEGIFQTTPDWADGTASVGSATTAEPPNLFDPSKVGTLDFSDVFSLANLQNISPAEREHLLIISQESGRIVNVDREGNVHSSLAIVSDPGNPLTVPQQTDEGVTMDEEGTLYVVNENGGGSSEHPQLWVYGPQTSTDLPPSGVALTNPTASLPEDTSTGSRVKVAGISVTDEDGFGENDLSVAGPDAADFEVDSNGLYLKAGTALDAATKNRYEVEVLVDDPAAGTSPDARSSTYALTITPVAAISSEARLAVTEAAPWSSGDSPWGTDWFEVTNEGVTAINLSGWKYIDSHANFSQATPLLGVGMLKPGQSAVFVEEEHETAFKEDWFPGGAGLPAGFQIGHYATTSFGLSTGGDQVNIFDVDGDHVAGIAFGASSGSPDVTFENPEGLGSGPGPDPTITKTAVAGTNGAFAVNGGSEVGSPGTAVVPTPVAVTEVAPWGSGEPEYEADWFELTNETSGAVSLAGWKMDDNSDAFGSAVALEGSRRWRPASRRSSSKRNRPRRSRNSRLPGSAPACRQASRSAGTAVRKSGSVAAKIRSTSSTPKGPI